MASGVSKKRELHRQPELPSLQRWQLQTAKAQFSEVFRRTRERARRVVTKQGKEAVEPATPRMSLRPVCSCSIRELSLDRLVPRASKQN
jgi:hypothetical protein